MKKCIPMLLLSFVLAPAAFANTAGAPIKNAATPDAGAATTRASEHPGKVIYDTRCGICHGRGERMPGTASLQAKYQGAVPAALEDRSDMPAQFIEFYVRNGVMIMPAFRKTEINDAELKALIEYLGRRAP
jgi:mono/diheme cytochrome c family protein